MNSIKLTLSGAFALLLLLVLASQTISSKDQTAAPASSENPAVLRIGTDGTAPAYYKADGQIQGFDHDIAEKVATKLGMRIQWVRMDFDALFPALKKGKIDMIAAEVTDTPEREQQFDFSSPYFVTYLSFLTPPDSSIKTQADVNGKRIAVLKGTIQETYAKQKYKNVKVVVRSSEDAAVKAVQSGQADAFFYDATYSQPIIDRWKQKGVPLVIRIRYPAEDAPIAFVLKKGDPRKPKVDRALDSMIVGGDWMEIKRKYFQSYPLSEYFASQGVS